MLKDKTVKGNVFTTFVVSSADFAPVVGFSSRKVLDHHKNLPGYSPALERLVGVYLVKVKGRDKLGSTKTNKF